MSVPLARERTPAVRLGARSAGESAEPTGGAAAQRGAAAPSARGCNLSPCSVRQQRCKAPHATCRSASSPSLPAALQAPRPAGPTAVRVDRVSRPASRVWSPPVGWWNDAASKRDLGYKLTRSAASWEASRNGQSGTLWTLCALRCPLPLSAHRSTDRARGAGGISGGWGAWRRAK